MTTNIIIENEAYLVLHELKRQNVDNKEIMKKDEPIDLDLENLVQRRTTLQEKAGKRLSEHFTNITDLITFTLHKRNIFSQC